MKTTVPKKLIKKAEKLIKDKSLSLTEPRKNILGFLLKKHGPFQLKRFIMELEISLATWQLFTGV